MFDRQEFMRYAHASLLTTTSLIATMLAGAGSLQAQTVVPAGTNLATLPPPVASDIWNLQGNATLFDPAATAPSFALALPAGAPGLSINGVASGSTITLNDGAGHFGFFVVGAGGTLSLSDVTMTGGSDPGSGGAINSPGALTLNTSGVISLTNDRAVGSGGGIATGGMLTIVGGAAANGVPAPATTLIISSDSAGQFGGAVDAGSGLVLTGSYNSILLQGDLSGATNNGGAIRVQGAPFTINATVEGDFTVSDNTEGSNGAFWATQGFSIAPTTTVGGTMAFTNNGGNAGGAIYTDGAITMGGSYGNILIADNTGRAGRGGALRAATAITIDATVSGTMAVTGNSAVGDGGAFVATGGFVTVTGSYGAINFSGNTSGTDATGAFAVPGVQCGGGGGAICAGNGNLTISATVAGTMTFADNTAVRGNGGALAANNGNVILDASPGNISLTGNTAAGTTVAGNGGAIYSPGATTITGNAITLTGNAATAGAGGAVYTVGDFTLNSASTTTISGNSAGTQGGALWIGGNATLNATGGDIAFSGNTAAGQANAIWFANPNSPIVGGGVTATFNAASGRTITFFDPIANDDAANGLLNVVASGPGAVVFDGSRYNNQVDQWSKIYATTEVQAGTFAIQNNAIYGIFAAEMPPSLAVGDLPPLPRALTSFTVDSDATLAGGIMGTVRADSFTLSGTLDISGSTALGHPVGTAAGGFSTFNVVSNNVSLGTGSQVLFNTYLNDAGVQRTDLLTLNLNGSATSGTADVRVTNVGGPGGVTVGNGIELVQVTNNNGTTAGAFNLTAPVVAGPYEYDLFHGSVDASGPQNWYLRSTLDCSLAPNAEVCAPPPPPTPPTPPIPPPPHFRVETSLNAALPAIALLYGRNLMDTLHERVGDEEDIRGLTGLYQNAPYTGGWARLIGTGGNEQGDPRGIFGSGPEFSYGFLGLQGGQDLLRREHDDGSRDHAGVTFAVGSAHGNVTHFDGTTGDDDLQAYTLGGYWTHFGAPGWYVDTMLQGTLYNARTTANRGLLPFKTNGDGIAGSVEAGYPFKFANGYFIEPQAQLIYQNINFNSAFDNEALVKFSNVDSLIGRIGARFGRTWSLDGNGPDARMITVWVRPNVWQEFRGNPITQFSSEDSFIPFRADLGGTWGEVNVGVSGQLNLHTTLFANASYQARFDGKGTAYDGKAGVRINW